jgi:hypothetical protein
MRGMGKWWVSDETESTERARQDAERRADRERRLGIASRAGYHFPLSTDPWPMFLDCPDCGALVTLSGVERHVAWHEERTP